MGGNRGQTEGTAGVLNGDEHPARLGEALGDGLGRQERLAVDGDRRLV